MTQRFGAICCETMNVDKLITHLGRAVVKDFMTIYIIHIKQSQKTDSSNPIKSVIIAQEIGRCGQLNAMQPACLSKIPSVDPHLINTQTAHPWSPIFGQSYKHRLKRWFGV